MTFKGYHRSICHQCGMSPVNAGACLEDSCPNRLVLHAPEYNPTTQALIKQPETVSANTQQIGGLHYASEYQHWDLIEDYNIGYCEAIASKYITRARQKNGLEDLKKGRHFVQKLRELHLTKGRNAKGHVPIDVIETYSNLNKLNSQERNVLIHLLTWNNLDNLESALHWIDTLIDSIR